jgi:2-dehydro-3-deoxy-L-rhamnonate dehydrogenase (NAD+)
VNKTFILGFQKKWATCDYAALETNKMNKIDLAGRVAVVTGGASGLGLAIGQRLAASGAQFVVWDRQLQASADAAMAHQEQIDVTDEASLERATTNTVNRFGKIDIMVCSAGITGPNTTTWQYSVKDWLDVININLNGVFLSNRAVLPHMLGNNYGRIINIASIAGKDGNPNAPAYSASKAGVIGLTKSLGKETAKTGIRVNCITPAAVATPMFAQMTQAHIDFMLSKIPMGRFGEVQEVAAMVAWMASEECSFTTGSVFDLSGGRAVY